jgi:hypothetical protein
MQMKKDDLQTIDQICLLNQKNALNSKNTMAKWKGLDKDNGKFTYLFCQGPCGLTPSARMARTLLDHENSSSSP